MQKIGNSSEMLSTKVESAAGTWTNAMAALAKNYAPQLKEMSDSFNKLAENLTGFISQNGPAIMTAIKMAGAFVGLKLAAFGLAIGIGLLTKVMSANPIMIMAQVMVVAAPLIIDNWELIVASFKKYVPVISALVAGLSVAFNLNPFVAFASLAVLAIGTIAAHWGEITAFIKDNFGGTIDSITAKFTAFAAWMPTSINGVGEAFKSLLPDSVLVAFNGVMDKIKDKFTVFVEFIKSSIGSILDVAGKVSGFFGQTPNGMRPPSYVAPLAKQAESMAAPAKNLTATPSAMPSLSAMQKAPIIKNLYSESNSPALKKYSDIGEMGIVNQFNDNSNATHDNSSRSNIMQMQQPTQRKSILKPSNGSVDVKVEFGNAPQGLRVAPAQTRGPVRVEQNVGYRSLGLAGAY
jgi:hypothetical protein